MSPLRSPMRGRFCEVRAATVFEAPCCNLRIKHAALTDVRDFPKLSAMPNSAPLLVLLQARCLAIAAWPGCLRRVGAAKATKDPCGPCDVRVQHAWVDAHARGSTHVVCPLVMCNQFLVHCRAVAVPSPCGPHDCGALDSRAPDACRVLPARAPHRRAAPPRRRVQRRPRRPALVRGAWADPGPECWGGGVPAQAAQAGVICWGCGAGPGQGDPLGVWYPCSSCASGGDPLGV